MVKKTLDELAVFDGVPLFEAPCHVGRPNVAGRSAFLERIDELLDRRWLTNRGPLVRELEEALRRRCEVAHCISVCNGTSGLQVAARALGLSGEVIVPSFTFVATAHALEWLGIEPVFCDIDPVSYTLDPKKVVERITPRTSGIVGVHLWGRPCDTQALEKIAAEHRLRLIFDAAHAFGVSTRGRMIGSFGDCEVMSFHATKYFHTFEGGAVTTDDDDLAETLRLMSNHGFSGYDEVISLGTNAKMSELSAAMGLTMLEQLDEIVEHNRFTHEGYARRLGSMKGVKLLEYEPHGEANYQFIVCEIDAEEAGIERDRIVEVLHAENVLARRYFHPGCHRMKPYSDRPARRGEDLRVTEALCERVLCLPAGLAADAQTVERICALLAFVLAHGPEISRRLDAQAP